MTATSEVESCLSLFLVQPFPAVICLHPNSSSQHTVMLLQPHPNAGGNPSYSSSYFCSSWGWDTRDGYLPCWTGHGYTSVTLNLYHSSSTWFRQSKSQNVLLPWSLWQQRWFLLKISNFHCMAADIQLREIRKLQNRTIYETYNLT